MFEEKHKKEIIARMKEKFGYKNDFSAPKIKKVVINVGTGSVFRDEQIQQLVARDIAAITGQKAAPTMAKRAISAFKSRQGMIVGYKATLRGKRMLDFIDRLINVVLPRVRDFRGLEPKSVDKAGNLTIGIKEHIIFPEISHEEIKKIFGLEITINISAKSREEALEFFRLLGLPLKKEKNN